MERIDEALAHLKEMQGKLRIEVEQQLAKRPFEIKKLDKVQIDGRIAAVDSGFLSARLHGVDLAIVKAAGVAFGYDSGKLAQATYYPSKNPPDSFEIGIGLEENEALVFRQLFRLVQEIGTATNLISELKPEMLLIDGSLLPLPSDRPAKDSVLYAEYEKLMKAYANMYEAAEKHRTVLIGVIKDTRAKRFVNKLELKAAISDSLFFQHYLRHGEAVGHLSYQDKADALADKVLVSYIKCNEGDLPLRIEFLAGTAEQTVLNRIYSLCMLSARAYPPPLIEADLRAMIQADELERLERAFHLNVPELHALRRNSRPFR